MSSKIGQQRSCLPQGETKIFNSTNDGIEFNSSITYFKSFSILDYLMQSDT